jgi:predicted NAD-dependent protein-ADP-ribosyltransferase YbiA (DUF1768 family)
MRDGGNDTQKQKGLRTERSRRRAEILDRDAVSFDSIDWGRVRTIDVSLEPQLVAQIRSRRRLRRLTLAVDFEPIEEARRIAARSGVDYQAVLRRWLIQGASVARTQRLLRQRHAAADPR